jgi:hypothetical protein
MNMETCIEYTKKMRGEDNFWSAMSMGLYAITLIILGFITFKVIKLVWR